MPVGQTLQGELNAVSGCEIAVLEAGIRYANRRDLVIFKFAEGTTVSATFTQNRFCAAPVVVAKKNLNASAIRALVINTGNANAGTGEQGLRDAFKTCDVAAECLSLQPNQVLPFSTGVIGEPLNMDRLVTGLNNVSGQFQSSNWLEAAHGIMTTDTVPKGISKKVQLSTGEITLTGISKGAGMIKPNMATMLSFVVSDAAVDSTYLDSLCRATVEHSFNRITVDGDTSTNDACVIAATGASGIKVVNDTDRALFGEALQEVMNFLAQAIVRDAEGATKFIAVSVINAGSSDEACRVGYAVAESPLVKTAFFASDPNWGRILAAVGRAGIADLDTSSVNIDLGQVRIVTSGGVDTRYTESAGQAVMDRAEIKVTIDLGRGDFSETIFTSDLSHDYVSINADYRS